MSREWMKWVMEFLVAFIIGAGLLVGFFAWWGVFNLGDSFSWENSNREAVYVLGPLLLLWLLWGCRLWWKGVKLAGGIRAVLRHGGIVTISESRRQRKK